MSVQSASLIRDYFGSITRVVFCVFVLALLFSANSYSELMCSDTQATADSGSLSDPGGPSGKYDNNQSCGFLIQPSGGGDITLTFSSFNYEYYYDTLKVYAGTDANGTLLGSFTGTSLPSPVVSTVGSLYIVHSTDYSKTRAGFSASWTTTAPIPGENRLCRDAGSTQSSGQLTDPGGALANYSNNQTCGFLIQPSAGGDITLTFSSFNYEYFYDDLRIYDGTSSSAKRIGKFTGTNLPASLTATSGAMYIVHDTDYSVTRSGFVATWSTAPANPNDHRLCRDFSSNESSGRLTDPGGPSAKYSNFENCNFLIQPTDSGDITLTFSAFEYENSYDYLSVYDGSSSAGIALGTFTGTALPSALVASSGAMYIVHKTDYSVIKDGFDANWSVQSDTPDEPTQCADLFPDGLSTHGTGQISFGYNAHLIGSPDNILAANTLSDNDGSSVSTCTSVDCETDPSAVLSTVSPGTFQTSSSTEDVNVGSSLSVTLGDTGNEYRNVSSNYQSVINFNSSYEEYKVNSLQLGSEAVLNLRAGTVYWLNSFTMSSKAVINVLGSGTATIIVNGNLQFSSPSYINSPASNSAGDASKLAIYANGNITLNNNATVSALVYAQGSLTLGSASYIFGAATANNISLNTNSTMTYLPSAVSQVDTTAFCQASPGPDHYIVKYDASSLTCSAPGITLIACADSGCNNEYEEATEVNLQIGSSYTSGTINFIGNATLSVPITVPSTPVISLNSSQPYAELECYQADADGFVQQDADCTMNFVDAGFQFINSDTKTNLPTQIAEKDFEGINLRAVKSKNDEKGVCEALLSGQHTVTLGYSCTSPTTCPTVPTFAGNNIVDNPNVLLNFDAQGVAELTGLNYADVGQINLSAQALIEDVTITSGNGDIDVIPASLQANVSLNGGASHYIAGQGFTINIQAIGVVGVTPLANYQPGDLQLSVMRLKPLGEAGVDGTFSFKSPSFVSTAERSFKTVGTTLFNLGKFTDENVYYTEVGSLDLEFRDNDYLDEIISSDAIQVNNIIPAYFTVIKKDPDLSDTCGGVDPEPGFTYLGQEFEFGLPAEFTIIAKNYLGTPTLNYSADADLWKLALDQTQVNSYFNYTDASTYTDKGTISTINKGNFDFDPDDGTDGYDGQATFSVADAKFKYNKVNTSGVPYDIVAPFESSINLTIDAAFFTDTDGVCFRADKDSECIGLDINNIKGTEQRYGRLALLNTYGPETEPLKVTLNAEYYDNNRWQINDKDMCTNIKWNENDGDIVLSGDVDLLDNIVPVTSDGNPDALFKNQMESGTNPQLDDMLLEKSGGGGPGVVGELTIALNPDKFPDFLNFNWDKDLIICSQATPCPDVEEDVDNVDEPPDFPFATVTFGLYRGNDRVINWREVYN